VSINDGRWVMQSGVSTDGANLVVRITAETLGYVGWAVSGNGSYFGADLIVAGVDSKTGQSYIAVSLSNIIQLKLY
jgi:hypothetical protein